MDMHGFFIEMRIPRPFSYALPVPDWLFREDLYLTHAGWERVLPGDSYPHPNLPIYVFDWSEGRVLPEYCLAWCLEGSGELETLEGRRRIEPGEAFFYRAGEWHRHRPDAGTGWVICWIHCNGAMAHRCENDRAFLLECGKPVIAAPELFQAQFMRLLESVHENPGCNSLEFSYQVVGLFSHFISDMRVHRPGPALSSSDSVRKARDYIMNHTHDSISVADVAAHVGCNRRTLEIQFRKFAGHTVLAEIQRCRTDRARALLVETDLPIKQVVHLSGFQSREQMRLWFQQWLGMTPGEVRRQNRERPINLPPASRS